MFKNDLACRNVRGVGQGRNFGRRQENRNQIEQSSTQNNSRCFGARDGSGAGAGQGRGMNRNTQPCQGNGKGIGLGGGRGKAHNRTFNNGN